VTRDLGHVPIGKVAPPLHRHTPAKSASSPPRLASCLARSAPSSAQVTDLLAGLGHDLLAGAGSAAFAAFQAAASARPVLPAPPLTEELGPEEGKTRHIDRTCMLRL